MTIMMSCDHHDEDRLIPDSRSRRRMLEQLRAADQLAQALMQAVQGGTIAFDVVQSRPEIRLDLARFVALMDQWRAWRLVAPRGDAWEPAREPPAEIRVAPLDDEQPGVASSPPQG